MGKRVRYDPNRLESAATRAMNEQRYQDAISIYYYMAEGDRSLDGGYLGYKIGLCYEQMGYQQQAFYWFGRAVEESPEIIEYAIARSRSYEKDLTAIL